MMAYTEAEATSLRSAWAHNKKEPPHPCKKKLVKENMKGSFFLPILGPGALLVF